jgi:hypothetical protein
MWQRWRFCSIRHSGCRQATQTGVLRPLSCSCLPREQQAVSARIQQLHVMHSKSAFALTFILAIFFAKSCDAHDVIATPTVICTPEGEAQYRWRLWNDWPYCGVRVVFEEGLPEGTEIYLERAGRSGDTQYITTTSRYIGADLFWCDMTTRNWRRGPAPLPDRDCSGTTTSRATTTARATTLVCMNNEFLPPTLFFFFA